MKRRNNSNVLTVVTILGTKVSSRSHSGEFLSSSVWREAVWQELKFPCTVRSLPRRHILCFSGRDLSWNLFGHTEPVTSKLEIYCETWTFYTPVSKASLSIMAIQLIFFVTNASTDLWIEKSTRSMLKRCWKTYYFQCLRDANTFSLVKQNSIWPQG